MRRGVTRERGLVDANLVVVGVTKRVEEGFENLGLARLADIDADGPTLLPKGYRLFFKRFVKSEYTKPVLDFQWSLQYADIFVIAITEKCAIWRLDKRLDNAPAAVGDGMTAYGLHGGP